MTLKLYIIFLSNCLCKYVIILPQWAKFSPLITTNCQNRGLLFLLLVSKMRNIFCNWSHKFSVISHHDNKTLIFLWFVSEMHRIFCNLLHKFTIILQQMAKLVFFSRIISKIRMSSISTFQNFLTFPWPSQKIFPAFGACMQLLNTSIDIHISLFLCKHKQQIRLK